MASPQDTSEHRKGFQPQLLGPFNISSSLSRLPESNLDSPSTTVVEPTAGTGAEALMTDSHVTPNSSPNPRPLISLECGISATKKDSSFELVNSWAKERVTSQINQVSINSPPEPFPEPFKASIMPEHVSAGDRPFNSSIAPEQSRNTTWNALWMVTQNRPDFESFAAELNSLIRSLRQQIEESPSMPITSSMARLAMDIEQRATDIKKRHGHKFGSDIKAESIDKEELIRDCRKFRSHFQQLQTNMTMGIWGIANEHSLKTTLKDINPSSQASYDSSLSAEISRRGCTEGTRIGVLEGLDHWLSDSTSSSIYWMNGMAGTGKTTIASTFCERVDRRKLLVGSFFCTRSLAECKSVARIIPTIAYQLAHFSTPFQSALYKILGDNPGAASKNVKTQFEKLLHEPLQQTRDSMPDNLVVVIDALDECEDRNGVELILDTLFCYAGQVPLKFLVTSRPEQDIYDKMSANAHCRDILHLHEIEKSLVRTDIELYLAEELARLSPSRSEIEQLAQRSGTLFIYAATLVRYISGKRSRDARRRLLSVLDITSEPLKKQTHQIDALYTAVLNSALSEDGLEDKLEDIRLVLWTVLLAQEPIGLETIANLAGIGSRRRVAQALPSLRSVLHQSERTELVSTLHASFPEFMLDSERSKKHFCNSLEHSQYLAWRCFAIMKEQLRFNICGLASSLVPDAKIEDLQQRIESNIPVTLAELSLGVDGLLKVQKWLVHYVTESSSELILFVDDARSFVTAFAVNPPSRSTPHIYVSSLPFCPRSNSVYKHYWERTRGLLELKGSLMERREASPLSIWTYSSEIQSLAISPDGTRVAIGCLDRTVSILSAYDGTIFVGPLEGHANVITSVAFSPDGGLVASASLGTFRVWNAYNGTLIAGPFVGHMRHVNSVSFSPDGRRVVTGGHDCTIRVWDIYKKSIALGPLTGEDSREGYMLCVTFSPDGTLFASASADGIIQLWNSDNGRLAAPPFKGHTGRVECLVFTPDGTRLVSSSNDNTIRVWNIAEESIVNISFEFCETGVNTLAISPDGTRIVVGSNDRAIRVWNVDSGKLVAGPFFGHSDIIKSVAYSLDGTQVFSGSSDKTIHVWNVRDGRLPPPLLPPQSAVVAIRSMTFCPDNTHVLSSDVRGVIRIWNVFDGSFVTSPSEGHFFPTPLSLLSSDGAHIASTCKGGKIQVTNTSDGSLAAGPFGVERASLSAFWFSHSNQAIIMGCGDGTIKVYDMRSGRSEIGSFKGHSRGVSSLTESFDCSRLVSYSDYENIFRVWNIGTPALSLEPLTDTAINTTSPDSYALVYDGWNINKDGWMVNRNQDLLFWLPPDVASAWCSPYAELVVTQSGILQVPKQKPIVGYQWERCYISK
ncbi:Vegetative incompatibility protein HET-E-1 [Rhizoctonia solani]|uniref:Vegetative incompatibility protein HET-E-1 n=1 Tax=Rhizoctonia solani TaxID=456999 RepID=A0A8H8P5R0_9AGAM|nr:Vegetative incompatibility protein HET-E-1 [Rhizoctonia solani]QRW26131.1 Vegetative incompatibility protein HET-E-1 [Rhizoctonia solani]